MDLERELNEKIAEYVSKEAGMSPYDRAVMEEAIWSMHYRIVGKGVTRQHGVKRDWLAKALKGKTTHIEKRGALLMAGAKAMPLWNLLESGAMSISEASDIMRRARYASKHSNKSLESCLKALIDGSVPVVLNNGITDTIVDSTTNARVIISNIRRFLMAYTREQLVGIDEVVAKRLLDDFDVSLEQSLTDFRARVRREKERGQDGAMQRVGQTRFTQVAAVLCLNGAKFGKPVDMKQARRNYNRLVRDLHPDRSGSRTTEDDLNVVVDAWRILGDYEAQLKKE